MQYQESGSKVVDLFSNDGENMANENNSVNDNDYNNSDIIDEERNDYKNSYTIDEEGISKHCCICMKKIEEIESNEDNLMNLYPSLYYFTYMACTCTCASCGQDIGFPESRLISMNQCNYCEHDSCKSCGINLDCIICQITACEECIDEDAIEHDICRCLKEKLNNMRKSFR